MIAGCDRPNRTATTAHPQFAACLNNSKFTNILPNGPWRHRTDPCGPPGLALASLEHGRFGGAAVLVYG